MRQNPYPGINAHLNSFLQNVEGEWVSFHAAHIVDLARSLNRHLPEGYEARVEKSLQIREVVMDDDAGIRQRSRRPEPDVMIVEVAPRRGESGALAPGNGTALRSSVAETMDDEDDEALLSAVVVRAVGDEALVGVPVTRIELLSPGNKPPAHGYAQYREKRNLTLRSGTPLVEIDYLHQSRPVARNQPSYPDRQPGARACAVIVSDPRPTLEVGTAQLYLFDAAAPIPRVDIPLAGGQRLADFDLTEAYNGTFEATPTYYRVLDYARPPLRFEAYSAEDQARIRAQMTRIADQINP